MKTKAQGLSLNTIIVAALALLVLIIMMNYSDLGDISSSRR